MYLPKPLKFKIQKCLYRGKEVFPVIYDETIVGFPLKRRLIDRRTLLTFSLDCFESRFWALDQPQMERLRRSAVFRADLEVRSAGTTRSCFAVEQVEGPVGGNRWRKGVLGHSKTSSANESHFSWSDGCQKGEGESIKNAKLISVAERWGFRLVWFLKRTQTSGFFTIHELFRLILFQNTYIDFYKSSASLSPACVCGAARSSRRDGMLFI
jgi:hypothetical protein